MSLYESHPGIWHILLCEHELTYSPMGMTQGLRLHICRTSVRRGIRVRNKMHTSTHLHTYSYFSISSPTPALARADKMEREGKFMRRVPSLLSTKMPIVTVHILLNLCKACEVRKGNNRVMTTPAWSNWCQQM